MLVIAKCGGDTSSAVTELWAEACRNSGAGRWKRRTHDHEDL
jgi:hypothetical protein